MSNDDQTLEAVPRTPWGALAYRWFVQYNPLYLVSAALVLVGVITLLEEVTATGGTLSQLSITGITEVYAWALIGSAALLYRINLRRPAVMLALLVALYQCDPALHTERSVYLGVAGVFGSAVWFASFVAKLYATAWAMKLRLALSARALAILGAAGMATVPWVLRSAEPDVATFIVGVWVFAVFALGLWTSRGIASRDRLDAWGTTVARRSVRGLWIGWGAAVLVHVVFLGSQGSGLSLPVLLPVALILVARTIESEWHTWGWLASMTGLIGVFMPEHLSLTALLVAASLCLRALRRPTRVEPAVREPGEDPYRTVLETDAPVAPTWTYGPAPRPELLRLATGAATALYLSAWTHGFTGGPWPDHVLWLDLLFAATAVGVLWRRHHAHLMVPTLLSATHLVLERGLLPRPHTSVGWGITAVSLGFAALALSLALSVHWRLRSRARPRYGRLK